MQAVVLASGTNSRVAHLFPELPKILFPLGGRPFADLYIKNLFESGITEIILMVNYKEHAIREYVARHPNSDKIRIVRRRDDQGPVGALVAMRPLLNDRFFLMYCDLLFPFDAQAVNASMVDALATTLITQDEHDMFDSMEIEIDETTKQVVSFERDGLAHDLGWMDVGSLNSIKILDLLEKTPLTSENVNANIWKTLIRNRQLRYRRVKDVYDIGTEKNYFKTKKILGYT